LTDLAEVRLGASELRDVGPEDAAVNNAGRDVEVAREPVCDCAPQVALPAYPSGRRSRLSCLVRRGKKNPPAMRRGQKTAVRAWPALWVRCRKWACP